MSIAQAPSKANMIIIGQVSITTPDGVAHRWFEVNLFSPGGGGGQ